MATKLDYVFNLSVAVHEVQALRTAAMEHDDAGPDDTFLNEDGSVNIGACLVMLLDPGKLPGCKVYGSSAEEQ